MEQTIFHMLDHCRFSMMFFFKNQCSTFEGIYRALFTRQTLLFLVSIKLLTTIETVRNIIVEMRTWLSQKVTAITQNIIVNRIGK